MKNTRIPNLSNENLINRGDMPRQVIVSGATGFIGQHLIPILLEKGYEVVALARDTNKAKGFLWFRQVNFISIDYHKQKINFTPAKGATLIHLAWNGLPDTKSLRHLEENLPKNYEFIKELVVNGVANVLVTGSWLEYGLQNGPMNAHDLTKPLSPYALSKDTLRRQLFHLQKELPFTLQWVRLFSMYGKGQHRTGLIAELDEAIEKGESTFNMSGGEQIRDYLPVESVVSELVSIFETKKNNIFNIGSGRPISVRRFVEERIKIRESSIKINIGHFDYSEDVPMAIWKGPEGQVTK